MSQAAVRSGGGKRAPARKAGAAPAVSRRRRALLIAAAVVVAWLALGQFVARPLLRAWLAETFDGEVSLGVTVLRPDLAVIAFRPAVEGDGWSLRASRVRVQLDAWGLFGGRTVTGVGVTGLETVVRKGARVQPFRESVEEGDRAADDLDLDPAAVPPLEFDAPVVVLVDPDSGERNSVFATGRIDVRQVGDRRFSVRTGSGALGGLPFEKLTTHLIPRAGHLLLNDLKLRAFNGIIGGVIDVDTSRAGAFNGELEGHFLEVEEVWRTFELPYAEKRRGDLSGTVVFEGAEPTLAALEGTGRLHLRRARFFSPLSYRVLLVLEIPAEKESMLTGGEFEISFGNALLYLEHGRLDSRDFDLDCRGIVSLADGRSDLEVSHAGTTVSVTGRLDDPDITVLPLDGVTAPFDRLFRERVKGAK